jgi:hypothetical protein
MPMIKVGIAVIVESKARVAIALCSFANISRDRCSTDADLKIETVKEGSRAEILSRILRMVRSGTLGTYEMAALLRSFQACEFRRRCVEDISDSAFLRF